MFINKSWILYVQRDGVWPLSRLLLWSSRDRHTSNFRRITPLSVFFHSFTHLLLQSLTLVTMLSPIFPQWIKSVRPVPSGNSSTVNWTLYFLSSLGRYPFPSFPKIGFSECVSGVPPSLEPHKFRGVLVTVLGPYLSLFSSQPHNPYLVSSVRGYSETFLRPKIGSIHPIVSLYFVPTTYNNV